MKNPCARLVPGAQGALHSGRSTRSRVHASALLSLQERHQSPLCAGQASGLSEHSTRPGEHQRSQRHLRSSKANFPAVSCSAQSAWPGSCWPFEGALCPSSSGCPEGGRLSKFTSSDSTDCHECLGFARGRQASVSKRNSPHSPWVVPSRDKRSPAPTAHVFTCRLF